MNADASVRRFDAAVDNFIAGCLTPFENVFPSDSAATVFRSI